MSDRADLLQPAMQGLRELFGKECGLALFVYDYGEGGRMDYVSTGDREDVCTALLEFVQSQEPEMTQAAFTRIFVQSVYGKEGAAVLPKARPFASKKVRAMKSRLEADQSAARDAFSLPGPAICAIRRRLGISQFELATELGLADAATVERWEKGLLLCRGHYAERLAQLKGR